MRLKAPKRYNCLPIVHLVDTSNELQMKSLLHRTVTGSSSPGPNALGNRASKLSAPGAAPFLRGALPGPAGRAAPSLSLTPSLSPVAVRSAMEEVDPYTGEVITRSSFLKEASEKVKAGQHTWAYRKADISEEDKAKAAERLTFVLIHGIGSSSYSYRAVLGFLGKAGYNAVAPDWIGHGDSDKPESFAYDEASYVTGLSDFIKAAGLSSKPFVLVAQGYVLGQYALKWALENEDSIAKLIILNTPLSAKAKLPAQLAPYKAALAFMRPKGKFDGITWNAAGSPYAMELKDAEIYQKPYDSPEGTRALEKTMEKLDWKLLTQTIDDEYQTWRVPSLLLFGGADKYLDTTDAFEFLESKRTNMRIIPFEAKVGYMPQEDFAEAVSEKLVDFVEGRIDLDNFNVVKGKAFVKAK